MFSVAVEPVVFAVFVSDKAVYGWDDVVALSGNQYDSVNSCIANVCYMCYIIIEVMKMPKSAVFNIRIEPEVKMEAEKLFSSFGLTVTDAVNVFLRQSIMQKGFPFKIVQINSNSTTQTIPKRKFDFISAPPLPDSFFDPLPEEELQAWGL